MGWKSPWCETGAFIRCNKFVQVNVPVTLYFTLRNRELYLKRTVMALHQSIRLRMIRSGDHFNCLGSIGKHLWIVCGDLFPWSLVHLCLRSGQVIFCTLGEVIYVDQKSSITVFRFKDFWLVDLQKLAKLFQENILQIEALGFSSMSSLR